MKKTLFLIASLVITLFASCNQSNSVEQKQTNVIESNDTIMKQFTKENLYWIREPQQYSISDTLITIQTMPNTDLWQRTYNGFCNDNAPVLQMKTARKYFSFTVKTAFNSSALFDQCGIVVYLERDGI